MDGEHTRNSPAETISCVSLIDTAALRYQPEELYASVQEPTQAPCRAHGVRYVETADCSGLQVASGSSSLSRLVKRKRMSSQSEG